MLRVGGFVLLLVGAASCSTSGIGSTPTLQEPTTTAAPPATDAAPTTSSGPVSDTAAARARWLEVRPNAYLMTLVIAARPLGTATCEYSVIDNVATLVSGPAHLDQNDGNDPGGLLRCPPDEQGTVEAQLERLEQAIADESKDDLFPVRYTLDDRGVPVKVIAAGDPESDGGARRTISVETEGGP